MSRSGWYGIDLDGTLAEYPHSFPEIGPPLPAMVERVRAMIAEGLDVRIFTARVAVVEQLRNEAGQEADRAFADDQRLKIENWCIAQFGVPLPVTALKDFKMILLYDDRCVQMVTNTGRSVVELVREAIVDPFQ